ncbi:MAG: gamma-glutamylcyclotransferase [Rhizobiales bacterium]|nr:gamma-glutamylcyclotransferase [Hyphomicrobiales bacterium]MBI3673905.1 gamma-glutamylcyclotransferase [Hyphomicrobiales bacterium]
MRLTSAHVRLVHRDVVDAGPIPGLAHFTDADYEAHLAAFLADRPDGPVGVFCYGSLIWKPAFPPAAVRRATALGWHRSFCLHARRFRGTAEVPGLMMQIDRGGTCDGVVQVIDRVGEIDTLRTLWRREMTVKPPGNYPRWIDIEAEGRNTPAIAFTANPDSPNYAGDLDTDHIAERLSEACGHWGSGTEYLFETITALEREGIHDPYLWDLQERVACLIEARFPGLAPAESPP